MRIPATDKREAFREDAHLNFMGGPSYDINDPIQRLRMVAASSFFGEPQYYHRDKEDKRKLRVKPMSRPTDAQVRHLADMLESIDPQGWRSLGPAEMMECAIDAALEHDPEATLQLAVELRQNDFIRTTPQVILVRACHHPKVRGTGLPSKYVSKIVHRGDEPSVCLAYHRWRYGKAAIPNSLKKALAKRLGEFDEYALAKYRREIGGFKLVDVVNLVRPKNTPAIQELIKGTLKLDDKTWEAVISARGSSQESWEAAIEIMGHMALLRNIRNMHQKGVPHNLYLEKLVKTAKYGRQLPFRYYSAYKMLKDTSPTILDAVEECLVISMGQLPQFKGRVMSLCDNSGSARGSTTSSMGTMQICQIANLSAVITAHCSEEGYVGVFGDNLDTFPVQKRSSVFDGVQKADKKGVGVGGGTENGIWLFWDAAIREKQHWDTVFIYSDMQAGHGGLYGLGRGGHYSDYIWPGSGNYIDVPKLIKEYRKRVNPNVVVFCVQVAGYQDTIVPENYNKTFILGGWGDGILKYAHRMIHLSTGQQFPQQ